MDRALSPVFLVIGASYKALYKTSFALFCITHFSLRAKSNKTDGNEASYKASYEATLTRKTRL